MCKWIESKVESRVVADAQVHYAEWLEGLRK